MVKSILRLSVVVGILWISLTACSPQKPIPDDIIGTWIEDRGVTCADDPATCACFEFFADGYFEAYNVPSEYFTFAGSVISYVSGTWKLDTSSQDPFAYQWVNLEFDESKEESAFDSSFYVPMDWQKCVMFAGDPDEPILFVKEDEVECE